MWQIAGINVFFSFFSTQWIYVIEARFHLFFFFLGRLRNGGENWFMFNWISNLCFIPFPEEKNFSSFKLQKMPPFFSFNQLYHENACENSTRIWTGHLNLLVLSTQIHSMIWNLLQLVSISMQSQVIGLKNKYGFSTEQWRWSAWSEH